MVLSHTTGIHTHDIHPPHASFNAGVPRLSKFEFALFVVKLMEVAVPSSPTVKACSFPVTIHLSSLPPSFSQDFLDTEVQYNFVRHFYTRRDQVRPNGESGRGVGGVRRVQGVGVLVGVRRERGGGGGGESEFIVGGG